MREVHVGSSRPGEGHYAPGMVAGGLLFVSGQLPVERSTGRLTGVDLAAQTELALRNMEQVLHAAGLSRGDVALCRVYLSDIEGWDVANRVYADFFGAHRPARVVVPAGRLHHGALVEIEAVAEMRSF